MLLTYIPIGGGGSTDPGEENVLDPASGGPTDYIINGVTHVGTLSLDFPTASQIANAVWDKAKVDHTIEGSFGASQPSVEEIVAGMTASGSGVTVGPTAALIYDNNLQSWNVDETVPGSILYEVVSASELKILMPSTADATNGDHIIFQSANSGGQGEWYYIIIVKGGVVLPITGSWVAGPSDTYPWIYVELPDGATAEQNDAILNLALNDSSLWSDFGMTNTSGGSSVISALADGVWNALTATYTTAGSFGVHVKKLLTVAKFLGLK